MGEGAQAPTYEKVFKMLFSSNLYDRSYSSLIADWFRY